MKLKDKCPSLSKMCDSQRSNRMQSRMSLRSCHVVEYTAGFITTRSDTGAEVYPSPGHSSRSCLGVERHFWRRTSEKRGTHRGVSPDFAPSGHRGISRPTMARSFWFPPRNGRAYSLSLSLPSPLVQAWPHNHEASILISKSCVRLV